MQITIITENNSDFLTKIFKINSFPQNWTKGGTPLNLRKNTPNAILSLQEIVVFNSNNFSDFLRVRCIDSPTIDKV